ncbi:MAG: hypothetical protein AB8H80_00335 [Planctomycetota bacterium]
MDRVDTLIQELSARHQNTDEKFLVAVRPMVERILAPDLPEESRIPLFELLAETFERDVRVRTDLAEARQKWQSFFDDLQAQIRELHARAEGGKGEA